MYESAQKAFDLDLPPPPKNVFQEKLLGNGKILCSVMIVSMPLLAS